VYQAALQLVSSLLMRSVVVVVAGQEVQILLEQIDRI